MKDDEIIVINFLTKIENLEFIPVPISNQKYLSSFIGEKVLITVRKRNIKESDILEDKKIENQK